MYDELIPEAEATIAMADAGEVFKKAMYVSLGALGGAFAKGTIAKYAKNALLASGIEAALGVFAGMFGAREGNELLLWGGVGIASHGLGAVLDAVLAKSGITAGSGTAGGSTGGSTGGGGGTVLA